MTSLVFGNFYFDYYTYRFGLGFRLDFGLGLGLGLRLGFRVSFLGFISNVCANGTFAKPLPCSNNLLFFKFLLLGFRFRV